MARGIVITLLLVSCLYLTYGWPPHQNGNHSLIIGRKGYNDVILFQKTVSRTNRNPWRIVSEDVTYPVRPIPGRRLLITEIDAIDLDVYNKGGYAYVRKGGINRNIVTIHFESQKGSGYKFSLTIFGRIY